MDLKRDCLILVEEQVRENNGISQKTCRFSHFVAGSFWGPELSSVDWSGFSCLLRSLTDLLRITRQGPYKLPSALQGSCFTKTDGEVGSAG